MKLTKYVFLFLMTIAHMLKPSLAADTNGLLQKQLDYLESQKGLKFEAYSILTLDNVFLEGPAVFENFQQQSHNQNLSVDLLIEKSIFTYAKVGTVVRFQNDFRGFYGAGDIIEPRQLYAQAYYKDVITFHAGNFHHQLTPTTFYAPIAPIGYEAELFDYIESIKQYHAQLEDEKWLVMGFYAGGKVRFSPGVAFDLLSLEASIIPHESLTFEQYLVTGQAKLSHPQARELSANYVGYFHRNDDLNRTDVFSVNGKYLLGESQIKNSHFSIDAEGEYAISLHETLDDASNSTGDTAAGHAARALLTLNAYGFGFSGKYLFTSFEFTSPAAQTSPLIEGELDRDQPVDYFPEAGFLRFHYADRSYRRGIELSRNYFMLTRLIFPMNEVTPNRNGGMLGVSYDFKQTGFPFLKDIFLEGGYQIFSEIRPARTQNIRIFQGYGGGLKYRGNQNVRYLPNLYYRYSYESQNRDNDLSDTSPAGIDEGEAFTVQRHAASLDWSFLKPYRYLKRLALLASFETVILDGRRWVDVNSDRDPLSENITSELIEEDNYTQMYLTAGFKVELINIDILLYYLNRSIVDNYSQQGINLFITAKF